MQGLLIALVQHIINLIHHYAIGIILGGFHYCLKISAIKLNTTVVTRSKNYVFQTCAPPDTPVLKLRASESNKRNTQAERTQLRQAAWRSYAFWPTEAGNKREKSAYNFVIKRQINWRALKTYCWKWAKSKSFKNYLRWKFTKNTTITKLTWLKPVSIQITRVKISWYLGIVRWF
jgi:hypothetical protein